MPNQSLVISHSCRLSTGWKLSPWACGVSELKALREPCESLLHATAERRHRNARSPYATVQPRTSGRLFMVDAVRCDVPVHQLLGRTLNQCAFTVRQFCENGSCQLFLLA